MPFLRTSVALLAPRCRILAPGDDGRVTVPALVGDDTKFVSSPNHVRVVIWATMMSPFLTTSRLMSS